MNLETPDRFGRWGELFARLGLSPTATDETPQRGATVTLAQRRAAAAALAAGRERELGAESTLAVLSGLLEPFFIPHIDRSDALAIARAGTSSPHMFRLFRARHEIAPVLGMCKQLKDMPVVALAYAGPKEMLSTLVGLLETAPGLEKDDRHQLANNISSYFESADARTARTVTIITEHIRTGEVAGMPVLDLLSLVEQLPAWALLTRDSDPLRWAGRHDELAVLIKNVRWPGRQEYLRTAAEMMSQAIAVFDEVGAHHDADVARMNLANVLRQAAWLTLEDRSRQALGLYESARANVNDPVLGALLDDSIAGLYGEMLGAGLEAPLVVACRLSLSAAETLHALGIHDRATAVFGNAMKHLLNWRDADVGRGPVLEQAIAIGERSLEHLHLLPHRMHQYGFLCDLAECSMRAVDYKRESLKSLAERAVELITRARSLRRGFYTPDVNVREHQTLANAYHALADHAAAIEELAPILDGRSREKLDPLALCEILKFKITCLKQLEPRGSARRFAAAEELADLTRDSAGEDIWVDAEAGRLDEAIAFHREDGAELDEAIARAEGVLQQATPDRPGVLVLQGVLTAARSRRHQRKPDELQRSFLALKRELPRMAEFTRISALANIALSWLTALAPEFPANFGEVDGAMLVDLEELAGLLESSWRQASDGQLGSITRDERRDIDSITRVAVLIASAVRSVASGADHSAVCAELEAASGWLEAPAPSGGPEANPPPFSNRPLLLLLVQQTLAQMREIEADWSKAARAWNRLFNSSRHVIKPLRAAVHARALTGAAHASARDDVLAALSIIAGNIGIDFAVERAVRETIADSPAEQALEREEIYRRYQTAAAEVEAHRAAEDGKFTVDGLEAGSLGDAEAALGRVQTAALRLGLPLTVKPGDGSPAETFGEATTVILLPAHTEGSALVIPPGATCSDGFRVALPKYRDGTVERTLLSSRNGWIPEFFRWRKEQGPHGWSDCIRATCNRLWDIALGPLDAALSAHATCRDANVNLIVPGMASLLPWSSASPSADMRETFGDKYALSLVPHIESMRYARWLDRPCEPHRAAMLLPAIPFLPIDMDALFASARSYREIPAIAFTDGMNDLPMSRLEGSVMRHHLGPSCLVFEGDVMPLALPAIEGAIGATSLLHFGCHGVWQPKHQWMTGLRLGELSYLTAARVRSRWQLPSGSTVVLSCCESGLSGVADDPSEGIGLVTAFLLAGARRVIASSWLVHDLASLVMMHRFYEALAGGQPPRSAVRAAQRGLRYLTRDELRALQARWCELRPDVGGQLRDAVARIEADSAGEHPFDSPAHWAAYFIAEP